MLIAAVHLRRGDILASVPRSSIERNSARSDFTPSGIYRVTENAPRMGALETRRWVIVGDASRIWDNETLIDVARRPE